MSAPTTIFVKLIDEPVDVWRPVNAERVDDHTYRIIDQRYVRDVEVWEFEPGSTVRVEIKRLEKSDCLVAVALA